MPKTQIVEAVYENGILRPLQELEDLPERSQVKVTIECLPQKQHPLLQFAGIISDSEAQELQPTIRQEFEKVESRCW